MTWGRSMTRISNTVLTIILLLVLAGCTHRPIPLATSYPLTTQHKMQAAHHWDVLAEDVASRLQDTINLTFPQNTIKPAIHIRFTSDMERTPFHKAFHNLLRNQLVRRGMNVVTSTDYSDTLILDYDMQVLYHEDRRLTYPPPGTFSALAGGVWLVAHGITQWEHPYAAAFPVTAAMDAYSLADMYLPGETNTEVIFNTSVTMAQQYIFGYSDTYYINDGDYDHYESAGKTIQVVDK